MKITTTIYCFQTLKRMFWALAAAWFMLMLTGASPVFAAYDSGVGWQMPSVPQSQEQALGKEDNVNIAGTLFAHVGHLSAAIGTYAIGGTVGRTTYGGAAPFFGEMIADMTVRPPVRTVEYVADVMNNAGFTSPAYAQGTGWKALTPILDLWKAFRNIAYMGFVIIFIVIGFMIMFRSKISSQAVVTVQAAMPQIIVTLLLITFSYAIASFIIDLIYLLIYIIIGIFAAFGIVTDPGQAQTQLLGRSIIENGITLMSVTSNGAAGAAADAVGDVVSGLVGENFLAEIGRIFSQSLAYVIFAIAILIAVFRVFFKLIMAYITLVFNVIFAPIILLFNAFPGSQAFSNWMKSLLANALVFPVTAILLLIGGALIGSNRYGIDTNIGYNAPGVESAEVALPLIVGSLDSRTFMPLIAIGFLMILPNILELTQKTLGVEGGVAGMMGTIMQPIGEGWRVASAPGRAIGGGARMVAGLGLEAGVRDLVTHGKDSRIGKWWTRRRAQNSNEEVETSTPSGGKTTPQEEANPPT
ncbi:MAG: hypothetical protein ACOX6V_03750 [Patescibacteria group bacterium]|jgi:hypothetical protein